MSDFSSKLRERTYSTAEGLYKKIVKLRVGDPIQQSTLDELFKDVGDLCLMVNNLARLQQDGEEEIADHLLKANSYCHTCWTSSYAPCEQGFPSAVPDGRGGWMYCQMCRSTEDVARLNEMLHHLECLHAS